MRIILVILDFPLYIMESLKRWSSLHGYTAIFMFLTTISKGSTCEAPSSPQCFRRYAEDNVYLCEWSMNMTESNVTFDLHLNETKFPEIAKTWYEVLEEQLTKFHLVHHIWVEAHVGNSSCNSLKMPIKLTDTVKYQAPQNISVSWIKNNLNLTWTAAEKYPALAEVWFQPDNLSTESWEKKKINTTAKTLTYQVIVANLLKSTAYQVRIRHQPILVLNPLWSDWSTVIVPAELEQPKVTMTKTTSNGTRTLMLTWKPVPHAAAVRGVKYRFDDTHSSRGCPCPRGKKRKRDHYGTIDYTTYNVLYSAVNITIIATNAAGHSPPAIIQVPAEPATDLKTCDKTLLNEKLKKTCLEWYELQDGDLRPKNVITRQKGIGQKQIREKMKAYVRYLYFEHRCLDGKPKTVKMCLFYKEEGVPDRAPQDFIAFNETYNSAELSWKAIPFVNQRGFLTHYILCSVQISSQDKQGGKCHNISASITSYHLENLTPGTKYNISLAGVTRKGGGLTATVTISTRPETPVNAWLSLGLLFMFFLLSIMCTFVLKRIKNMIFPPVPTPVILDFTTHQPESQERLEKEEEVCELTMHQLHPERKTVLEDAEETTVREWDDNTDEDVEDERGDSWMLEGTSDECLSPGSTEEALGSSREEEMTDMEQMDEITLLIYKRGLVFDVKTDSLENGLTDGSFIAQT
ncbi:interleukin-6 receptor subunit beta [Scomber japonicus]|uniref:interleukin-6 receptor subunit beta n=1 Tax=Scomber japonicus TaxID=13676 RepID=UPI0023067020|nr:interleukin-6 receptor subunit beta [Scomber japonicus]